MPRKRKPTYTLHKATGQARVRINGQDHYLGEYGSAESRARYDDLIAEWLLRYGDTTRQTLTVDDLAILFIEDAEKHYRRPDGTPTGSAENMRHALRPLVKQFGRVPIREFGPRVLKEFRDHLVAIGHCRTHINRKIGRVRQVFRWGVENEYCPVEVYQSLLTVTGIRPGRKGVRESEPIRPVAEGTVTATLPHLPPAVAAMVKLQLLTGARPGEICAMRPCDITFGTDGVWVYRPASHKTEHHGRERRIFIGPEGQEILRPFLEGHDPDAHCFSPAESEAMRNAERKESRRSPITPS
jgi:integrase